MRIVHYSKSGSELKSLELAKNSYAQLEMASDDVAIIINSSYQNAESTVIFWDLKTY